MRIFLTQNYFTINSAFSLKVKLNLICQNCFRSNLFQEAIFYFNHLHFLFEMTVHCMDLDGETINITNVWCIKNRTNHSSKALMILIRFLLHQTLFSIFRFIVGSASCFKRKTKWLLLCQKRQTRDLLKRQMEDL